MADIVKYTSQYMDNMSFDEGLGVNMVEIIGADGRVQYSDPTEGYKITDIDSAGYYGYMRANDTWYIMQGVSGAYRYIKGDSDYATNWSNRIGLAYDYFNIIF